MIEYKVVKHCGLCKERFVVSRENKRQYYCDKCQSRIARLKKRDEKKEKKKNKEIGILTKTL